MGITNNHGGTSRLAIGRSAGILPNHSTHYFKEGSGDWQRTDSVWMQFEFVRTLTKPIGSFIKHDLLPGRTGQVGPDLQQSC